MRSTVNPIVIWTVIITGAIGSALSSFILDKRKKEQKK
jgi:uncharacterized membrane protein YwzB